MRLRLRALCQLAVFALSCGTATFIVQQYDGPPRPREQIAVLRLNGKDPVRVESLDGERLDYQLKDKDTRVHIELLPGTHELAVTDAFGLAEPFRFVAAAGHVYRPIMNPVYRPGSLSFVLQEVDVNTDAPLAAVPQAPEPKPPARSASVGSAQPLTPTLHPTASALQPSAAAPATASQTFQLAASAAPSSQSSALPVNISPIPALSALSAPSAAPQVH